MKISVVMATYNGEKYIIEQLNSLLNQTLKPDEVIICDDKSTDKTVYLIKNFIKHNQLSDSWKIYVNTVNKGYTRNFLDCASLAKGDLIFFCDQDDIWHPQKIRLMTNEFKKNSKIEALSCTFHVIDEFGNKKNTLLNRLRMGNGKLNKIEFSKQVKNNFSVGLTLAVRKEMLKRIKPIILKYNLPYDVPIGLFTSVNGGYYILGVPLVYRRVHSNNISAPKYTLRSRLKNIDKHIEGRLKHIELLNACLQEMGHNLNKNDKENLIDVINILNNSVENLKKRNVWLLFKDLFSRNPMVNKLLVLTNIICALLGDYSKIKKD